MQNVSRAKVEKALLPRWLHCGKGHGLGADQSVWSAVFSDIKEENPACFTDSKRREIYTGVCLVTAHNQVHLDSPGYP